MGYPQKLLNPGEQLAVDVGPHWKYLALPAFAVLLVITGAVVALAAQVPRWAELAIAGVMVVSLLWLAVRYLRWATTSFVATNQRLIMRRGVLRRTGREILLDRLADITYRQTLTDRLLGCGDILLESPGRQGQEVLVDLPHAVRIQNEICRLVNQRQGVIGPSGGWRAATAPAPTGPTVTDAGPQSVGAATGALAEPTVAEQLSQLDDLRRRGVISRREFAAKKSELLSRM